MPVLDHDGAHLHYEIEGDGPPILLIMGLGYPASAWWRVLPWLSALRTTIRLDNRGVGGTGPSAPPYAVSRMATDALAVMQAAGFDQADVWGVSMGGTIAQEIALSHPQTVRRLILGCTHPGATDFVIDRDAMALLGSRRQMSPREAAEAAIPFVYAAATSRDDIDADIDVRLQIPTTAQEYAAQLAGAAQWQGSGSRLESITAETLVIHGTADRLVLPSNGRFLAERIPGARWVALEGASHIFWTDQPHQTRRAVTDFLT